MESEYEVESAVGKIGAMSEKRKTLNDFQTYNYALWMTHYMMHLEQIETMRNLGDIMNTSSIKEMKAYQPENDSLGDYHLAIGNLSPDSYVENGVVTRIVTQWAWGEKQTPPFIHSQDAFNVV